MTKALVRLALCALCVTLIAAWPRSSEAGGKKKEKAQGKILVVLDSPYQLWNQGGTLMHLVAFDQRLRPLARAEVRLAGKRLGFTDKHGTLIFRFRARPKWRGGRVVVRKRVKGRLLQGSIAFTAYRRTSSFAVQRVYLYTDRTWYRPGGKVRARVIAWNLKQRYRPAARRKATVTLRGPHGDLGSRTVTLDAFGTGHVTFDLAERETGSYTLRARVGKATHSRTLKVAWFTRPELEIQHTFPSYVTRRTRHLDAQVTLTDLLGRSPRRGTLVVEASGGGGLSVRRTLKLDGRAGYRVRFRRSELRRLMRKLSLYEALSLNIEAKLANGTTSSLEHELNLTDNPYKAVVELDRDKYREGQTVVAVLKLNDEDGNPVRRKRVWLTVPRGPKRTRRVYRTTDRRGVATFRFKARGSDAGDLEVTAHVRDVRGKLAEASAEVSAAGSLDSKLGQAQVASGARVPITVTLRRGFFPLEKRVHCDVTDHTGAIVAAFTLPIQRRGGRWVAKGTFRAPSWGSMLITMFTVGVRKRHRRYYRRHRQPLSSYVAGLLVEGQSITVHPNQALKLKLRGLPKRAKPGTPVRLDLEVRDARGRLRDAAVSATLVDSNVLALGDPLKKISPATVFYNGQLRVMASTGAKILTWPVVSRTWGCTTHDIALPPFEFQEGDGCGEVEDFSRGASRSASGLGGLGLGGGGRGGGGAGAGGVGFGGWGTPPELRVRRRFAPTALWAPGLRARRGRLTHRFRLPDTLSRQTLLVVASDKRGGVGVLRRTVTVLLPVAVRVQAPPKMVATDELTLIAQVRNYTPRARRLRLTVAAQRLQVIRAPKTVVVAPGREQTVRIRIRATQVGAASLRIAVREGRLGDAVEHRLQVLPHGAPQRTTQRRLLKPGSTVRFTVTRPASIQAQRVRLALDVPNAIPVVASIQRVLAHPSLGGDSLASVLRSVALVLRYKQRVRLDRPTDQRYVGFLIQGMRALLKSQAPDGSFSYWRLRTRWSPPRPDPYHTAYVLETLLDLREAGIDVPVKALRRAAWSLLTSRAPDGLWDVRHLAFWEGRSTDVRTGLSAEIFRAVARASQLKCRYKPNRRLMDVATKMRRLVASSRDPRTVAAGLAGLHWLYTRCGKTGKRVKKAAPGLFPRRALSRGQRRFLVQSATRLLRLRKRRYWEPSWFSAYGGTLEATAAVLTVLHRLDRRRFRHHLRSGMQYLLDRRDAWGEWHNERGTAASLRALMALSGSSRPERSGAVITVRVNGRLVRRVKVDPKDPYGSALNLRALRLTRHLTKARNTVEVRYTGRLRVPARLVVTRWMSKATAPPPRRRSGPRARLAVRLRAPQRVTRGRPFFAVLELTPRGKGSVPAAITVGLPTTVQLSAADLTRLRRASGALRARRRGRLVELHLPRLTQRRRLVLRLTPHLAGLSPFLAPTVTPLSTGRAAAAHRPIRFESK